jgi:Condensation domain
MPCAEFLSRLRGLDSGGPSDLPPIAPAEGSDHLKLSFAQQRLWFLAQLEGASEAYHIVGGFCLRGDLDEAALRQALDRVVARHEVLRTTFSQIDGEPIQRIAGEDSSRFHLLEHDLRQHADANGELGHLIKQESREPFDLERGPLIRGRLIRQAEAEYTLLITMHHIVSDGWSMAVLFRELSALYTAYQNGKADPLPRLRLQYADYAAWQRRWIAGEVLQKQAEYWKAALARSPAVLELPMDHARSSEQDYAGAVVELVLDAELTKGLKALSKRHEITLFMTLLAGWAVLLGRLSGQEDLVIGVPVANRRQSEIEGLIGLFVNTLALRLDLSGSPTVGELLDRVKVRSLAAQQHQDIPFEHVVEIVRPMRSLAHNPLFQVMFAWQNTPEVVLHLPGLEVEPLEEILHDSAQFELTLTLQEAGESIVGGIEYVTSLFDRSTVERYAGHLRTLLEAMVSTTPRPLTI